MTWTFEVVPTRTCNRCAATIRSTHPWLTMADNRNDRAVAGNAPPTRSARTVTNSSPRGCRGTFGSVAKFRRPGSKRTSREPTVGRRCSPDEWSDQGLTGIYRRTTIPSGSSCGKTGAAGPNQQVSARALPQSSNAYPGKRRRTARELIEHCVVGLADARHDERIQKNQDARGTPSTYDVVERRVPDHIVDTRIRESTVAARTRAGISRDPVGHASDPRPHHARYLHVLRNAFLNPVRQSAVSNPVLPNESTYEDMRQLMDDQRVELRIAFRESEKNATSVCALWCDFVARTNRCLACGQGCPCGRSNLFSRHRTRRCKYHQRNFRRRQDEVQLPCD